MRQARIMLVLGAVAPHPLVRRHTQHRTMRRRQCQNAPGHVRGKNLLRLRALVKPGSLRAVRLDFNFPPNIESEAMKWFFVCLATVHALGCHASASAQSGQKLVAAYSSLSATQATLWLAKGGGG